MKLKLLFIMSFFCIFYNTVNAQSESQGEIIKQCVALQELQKKVSNEIKQNMNDLLILNQKANIILT